MGAVCRAGPSIDQLLFDRTAHGTPENRFFRLADSGHEHRRPTIGGGRIQLSSFLLNTDSSIRQPKDAVITGNVPVLVRVIKSFIRSKAMLDPHTLSISRNLLSYQSYPRVASADRIRR